MEAAGAIVIVILMVLASACGLLLYLLPAIVAGARGHQDALAITALTILLGWSLIGWAVALVWSLKAVQPRT
ncbi:MAG: superinfection immunity protein [Planctomycetaceae bacterium]|nr:superinfection immunity protein [Planctomycetaceae bacterium]